MVTLTPTFLNPFSSSFISPSSSSSSSQVLFTPSATPYLTSEPHQWFSLMKLTATTGRIPQFKPSFAHMGFKGPRFLFIQCSSTSSSHFGTEIGRLSLLLQEIGLSEKEIDLLANTNPAIGFVTEDIDGIRNRIASLQSLGIMGVALCRLIMKRPDVLTAKEIDPLIHFIRGDLEGKMEAAQLRRLLTVTEPRFLMGFDLKARLLLQYGIPQEELHHVLNKINLTKSICLKSSHEIKATLAYLDRFGGAGIVLRRPATLNYDLNTQLIPRIGFLSDLGGGDEDATRALLRKLPAVLAYSVEHVEGHVEFLSSFAGLTREQIFKVMLVFPNVVSASQKRKLHPRIEFLKNCGLNSNEIFRFLIRAPLFLGLSFEGNLACKLSFLLRIGYECKTKELALAMGAVTRTSSGNLQEVINLFLRYGLGIEEIVEMSKKHPQVLQYKPSSLEEKMEYLIGDMGRKIGELLTFPAFLGYKLDERIKQRYEVRKKIMGEGMSINKLLCMSSEEFEARKK